MTAGTDKVRAEILANINKQEKNLEDGISQLKALDIGNADDIELAARPWRSASKPSIRRSQTEFPCRTSGLTWPRRFVPPMRRS